MHNQSFRPEDSIEILVSTYENKLYRTAIALMKNKADAEEVVQESFIKLFAAQQAFHSLEHEEAWLMRVTINLCKSRLHSSWWKKTVPLLDTYPAQSAQQSTLVEAVMALPSKYRMVIHLFYYEGYSTKEIAVISGQKESTVRSMLTRARQKLKDILQEDEL